MKIRKLKIIEVCVTQCIFTQLGGMEPWYKKMDDESTSFVALLLRLDFSGECKATQINSFYDRFIGVQ